MSQSSFMEVEHKTLIFFPFIKDALCSAKHFKTHPISAKILLDNRVQACQYIIKALLVSLEWVDHVSNGLHCICIAFQFTLSGRDRSNSDSVKPEKQRSSHCMSIFLQLKHTTISFQREKGRCLNWIVLQRQHPSLMREREWSSSRFKGDKRKVYGSFMVPLLFKRCPSTPQAPVPERL